jgi:hypothetical protein
VLIAMAKADADANANDNAYMVVANYGMLLESCGAANVRSGVIDVMVMAMLIVIVIVMMACMYA